MPKKQRPKERVTILHGKEPILLTCPHGFDDNYTNIIVEAAATELDANALINHAWRRSKKVNEIAGEANCNNVSHIMDPTNMAVNDEYGKPFVRLINRMEKKLAVDESMLVLHIHGVGNWVKKQVPSPVQAIIGYGRGKKPSFSCDPWVADAMAGILHTNGIPTYMGAAEGRYSARMKNNVNQFYRLYNYAPYVQSMQIEFTNDLRDSEEKAEETGLKLAKCIKYFFQKCSVNNYPTTGVAVPEI